MGLLLICWLSLTLWMSQRQLPPGLHLNSPWQPVDPSAVHFLADLSWADATGAPLSSREIDAALRQQILQARKIVVLDTGVFGDLPATGPGAERLRKPIPIAAPLIDALLAARRAQPALHALLLFDPATLQISSDLDWVQRLAAAGVDVVPVDAHRLREANPMFAAAWRMCCIWSASRPQGSWPNPLGVGASPVSFGLWGRVAGFQRSHRQVLLTDNGNGALTATIVSRPMHAEAGLHTAVALQLSGAAVEPLLETEFVVAQFSGWSHGGAMQQSAQRLVAAQHQAADVGFPSAANPVGTASARALTEGAIGDALTQRIWATQAGDEIVLAALYLAQRELVQALLAAAHRGVTVRVLLDPCKDGYGLARSGMPNRQVATELAVASDGAIRVRWYRTHGEQFSPGMALIHDHSVAWLLIGTAELTRRDLGDVDLAAAYAVQMPATTAAATEALTWFDQLWYNRAGNGVEYSSDVDLYADGSQVNYWKYRLFEASGAAFD